MTVTAKPNPLAELLVTLLIPSLILMKLSGPDSLGAVNALGLLNILLTGGIGLLQMDTQWLAIKEAAIPGLIGLGTVVSAHTRYPLVRIVLFSESLMNVERIQQRLNQRGNSAVFDARLKVATWMLGGSFFFSAVMNYTLAIWIVVSPAGTTAFNEELGRLTLLSYPMIALPSMLIMVAVLYYLARSIRELAGLKLAEALKR